MRTDKLLDWDVRVRQGARRGLCPAGGEHIGATEGSVEPSSTRSHWRLRRMELASESSTSDRANALGATGHQQLRVAPADEAVVEEDAAHARGGGRV
jgi:hypothetical protein